MADLVTIKSFFDRMEAELARSFLEANGIPAIVTADDCGGMRPYMQLGSGGARLLVLREDAHDGLELLRTGFPIPAGPPGAATGALPIPGAEAQTPGKPRTRVVPRSRRPTPG